MVHFLIAASCELIALALVALVVFGPRPKPVCGPLRIYGAHYRRKSLMR